MNINKELYKVQQFIDINNFEISVDAVIDYYKDFYSKGNYKENDYSTVCKYCKNELDIICS